MHWLALAALPLLLLAPWLFTSYLARTLPTLHHRRILLLIAHPDDEAMFFAPSLRVLSAPHLANTLHILCLSTGNAAGLGPTRAHELRRSAHILLRGSPAVTLHDDPAHLPDSMAAHWDPARVAARLRARAAAAPFDVLLTFDARGVSAHPNHVALWHGARRFAAEPAGRDVAVYALETVGLARKYLGVVDAVVSGAGALLGGGVGAGDAERPARLVMVSAAGDVRAGQRAMTQAHRSQMRWFRWGWIGLSRYMVVNELRRVEGTATAE